jgi:hypothetical protein
MTDVAMRPVERSATPRGYATLDVAGMVELVQRVLGRALFAITLDRNPKTIARWVNGELPRESEEQRLRDLTQILELMLLEEEPSVVRAWFMGMNPQLDDESPAEVFAAGRARDVIAAARAFLNAG